MKSLKLKVLLAGLGVVGVALTLGLGTSQAQETQVYRRAHVTCVGFGGIIQVNEDRWEDVRMQKDGNLIHITGRVGFKNVEAYCATAQVNER